MTTDEALDFLRSKTPLPADDDLSDELISQYDEVREYFLENPDIRSVPLFLNSFGDGSGFGVYQLVEDVLRRFPKETVLPYLLSALERPRDSVRYWTIQMTSSFADPVLVPPLLRNVEHPNADIRSMAADALSFVADGSVIHRLEDLQRNETNAAVRAAIEATLSDLMERS